METTYRVIFLILGLLILIGVAWDIWRRKNPYNGAAAKHNGKHNDKYGDKHDEKYSNKYGDKYDKYSDQNTCGVANDYNSNYNSNNAYHNKTYSDYAETSVNRSFSNAYTNAAIGANLANGTSRTGGSGYSPNSGYVNMPMANRQLETIMPSDPRIVKVPLNQLNEQMDTLEYSAGKYSTAMANGYVVRQEPEATMQTQMQMQTQHVNTQVVNREQQQAPENGLIISLSVISRMQRGFPGYKLLKAFESAGLVYGKMNIFHRYAVDNTEFPLFSISSAVEPGMFVIEEMTHGFVPGVTLFMTASSKIDCNLAFDLLVRTAKQLGFSLNGELRDHKHKPLTVQTIEKYRSMVMAYATEYA